MAGALAVAPPACFMRLVHHLKTVRLRATVTLAHGVGLPQNAFEGFAAADVDALQPGLGVEGAGHGDHAHGVHREDEVRSVQGHRLQLDGPAELVAGDFLPTASGRSQSSTEK
jgi:hypothetical protein